MEKLILNEAETVTIAARHCTPDSFRKIRWSTTAARETRPTKFSEHLDYHANHSLRRCLAKTAQLHHKARPEKDRMQDSRNAQANSLTRMHKHTRTGHGALPLGNRNPFPVCGRLQARHTDGM